MKKRGHRFRIRISKAWASGLMLAFFFLLACGAPGERDSAVSRETGSTVAEGATDAAAPVIQRLSLTPDPPVPGERVRVRVDVDSPDSRPLDFAYTWRVDGKRSTSREPELQVPEGSRGSLVEVMVIARDGRLESQAARVSTRVANRPPEIKRVTIEPGQAVTVEDQLFAAAQGSDPDGDALEYRYSWVINGRSIDAKGPRLPARLAVRGDRVVVSAVATDGHSESAAMRSRSVTVGNAPPRIEGGPGAIEADGVFRYQPRVSDPDQDRFFGYSLLEAPEGMRIDRVNGRIEWRPSEEQSGSHPVVLRVDDRNGAVVTQRFRVEVSFRDFPVAGRRT